MRYLISWNAIRVPPEMAKVALALLKASDEYTENLVKKGTIKELWAYADGSGGGCIGQADSHETADKMMMANPYAPFLEYSITPIIDFKVASDSAKEYLKKISR